MNRSPVREGSEERRAKIEQWNREREQQTSDNHVNSDDNNNSHEKSYSGDVKYANQTCGYEEQRQQQSSEQGYGH